MSEPFDVYSDQIQYWTNHWGTNISFHLMDPIPDPNAERGRTLLGTVRLSNEHLKVLLFQMARNLAQQEMRIGARYDATQEILDQIGVSQEEWKRFWDMAGG